jgi:hypothetical protein
MDRSFAAPAHSIEVASIPHDRAGMDSTKISRKRSLAHDLGVPAAEAQRHGGFDHNRVCAWWNCWKILIQISQV